MPHVVAACSSVGPFTGGLSEFDVEADTVGRLIVALDARFPNFGEHIRKHMAIAIDGEIHQGADAAALTPTSEVFLIPRISGG